MITSRANVQNCTMGRGYGTLMMFKYLANIQYESCELPDTAAYTAHMNNLMATAVSAIMRVQTTYNP